MRFWIINVSPLIFCLRADCFCACVRQRCVSLWEYTPDGTAHSSSWVHSQTCFSHHLFSRELGFRGGLTFESVLVKSSSNCRLSQKFWITYFMCYLAPEHALFWDVLQSPRCTTSLFSVKLTTWWKCKTKYKFSCQIEYSFRLTHIRQINLDRFVYT